MEVLVTGGTGFVGGATVRRLLASGHSVRVLARRPGPHLALEGVEEQVSLRRGDLSDAVSLREALRGCQGLVHAAAYFHTGSAEARVFQSTNEDGTLRVLDAARRERVERIVVVSSIAAVARGTLESPATEESAWDLGTCRIPYIISKRRQEEAALAWSRREGVPISVVNPAFVLGPGEVKPMTGLLVLLAARGLARLVPTGNACVVDVRDVAWGVEAALRSGRPGRRYILSATSLSYLDLLGELARAAGAPPPLGRLPSSLAVLGGILCDLVALFTALSPPYSSAAAFHAAGDHCCSGERARRELGVQYRPLAETAADAVAWFREHGFLEGSPLQVLARASGRPR